MDLVQQWPYIEQVAAERLQNNQTKRHVSQYGTYIEVIGAAGELAARRFFQLPETLHTHLDGGCDMYYKGMRIDIKATVWTPKLQFRYLQWPRTKPVRSDVILLTAVNIETKSAILAGYALPDDIKKAPINTERDFPCYEIPVPSLRKASALLRAEDLNDLYPSYQAYPYRGYAGYQEGKVA
jgi:hypothetical protein